MYFKKGITSFLSVVTILFLMACGHTPQSSETTNEPTSEPSQDNESSTPEFVLKFAGQNPDNHYLTIHGDKFFIEKLYEYSDGRIDVEFYPGNQLGKAEDFINLLNSGVADFAQASPANIPGKMPLSNVFALPQAIPDAEEGTRIAWEILNDPNSYIRQIDYDRNDMIPVYVSTLPLYEIVMVNKSIHSIEDLKGMKLRSAGGAQDLVISSLGATPVKVSREEQYQSLERGTLDGGIFNLPSLESNKIDEITNFSTTNAALTTYVAPVSISKNTWEKLPSDLQQAVIKAGEETVENLASAMTTVNEEAIKKMEEQDFEFYQFTEEQLLEIKERTAPVWDDWVEVMKKQNLDGNKAIEELNAKL